VTCNLPLQRRPRHPRGQTLESTRRVRSHRIYTRYPILAVSRGPATLPYYWSQTRCELSPTARYQCAQGAARRAAAYWCLLTPVLHAANTRKVGFQPLHVDTPSCGAKIPFWHWREPAFSAGRKRPSLGNDAICFRWLVCTARRKDWAGRGFYDRDILPFSRISGKNSHPS